VPSVVLAGGDFWRAVFAHVPHPASITP
jgi:hypothetical protein